MIANKKLLYFSLNPHSTKAFHDYIKRTLQDRRNSFCICSSDKKSSFKHASDLTLFLENQPNLGNFYVIIDYLSFYNCHLDDHTNEDGNTEKDKISIPSAVKCLNFFSPSEASDIIAKTILRFPEVMFLFDESWHKDSTDNVDFTDFIFYNRCDYVSFIYKRYHQYRVWEPEPFAFIQRNWDNLYDGSNLRFAIKRYFYSQLHVNRFNFSTIQDSRATNLALCIEEEHSQNRFNSYALYANGFRVLPVSSSKDLKAINANVTSDNALSPSIVVRDYDLQFPDVVGGDETVYIDGKQYKINEVDYIRGIKFWDSEGDSYPPSYQDRWYIPPKSQKGYDYWTNLQDVPTLFLSKGASGIVFCKTERELSKELGEETSTIFQDGRERQAVRGLRKPVSGIYCPFHFFEIIEERYHTFEITDEKSFVRREAEKLAGEIINKYTGMEDDLSNKKKEQAMSFLVEKYHLKKRYQSLELLFKNKEFGTDSTKKIDKQLWKDELKKQEWIIDTSRENHNHGVPLVIYDLIQSMLARAKHYYNIGKYIRSAIIASEAIEILNGFHEALMIQAYHILAISENAIAMNAIGGSELALKEDTLFRITKIQHDIDRLLNRSKNEEQTNTGRRYRILNRLFKNSKAERREFKYNILNQIFSDCRKVCKDKEYFGAEDCYISAMAFVNEGFIFDDILYDVHSLWKRIKNSWKTKKNNSQK